MMEELHRALNKITLVAVLKILHIFTLIQFLQITTTTLDLDCKQIAYQLACNRFIADS